MYASTFSFVYVGLLLYFSNLLTLVAFEAITKYISGIRTKAHRAIVSMMAKVSIVTRVLTLRYFLFLLPKYIHIMQL